MADGTIGSEAVVGSTFWRNTDKTHIMPEAGQQATADGNLYKVDIYIHGGPSGDTFTIKIFRINGANYDYIGGQVLSGLAAGLNSNVPISPVIPVLTGDIIGLYEDDFGQGIRLTSQSNGEDNKAGDIISNTAIATWTGANWLLSLKGYITSTINTMMIQGTLG